jgi:hypothetical protein
MTGRFKNSKLNLIFKGGKNEERKVFAIAGHLLFVFFFVYKKTNPVQPRTVAKRKEPLDRKSVV